MFLHIYCFPPKCDRPDTMHAVLSISSAEYSKLSFYINKRNTDVVNFPFYVTKHIQPVPIPVGNFSFIKIKRI